LNASAISKLKEFERSLWGRYYDQNDTEIDKNYLIEHYWPDVQKLAKQYRSRGDHRYLSADEYASLGFDGLIFSIDRFSLDKNVLFMTFAAHRIVGAMIDGLRELDPMSRTWRSDINKMENLVLTTNFNRPNEVAKALGWTMDHYWRVIDMVPMKHTLSLEELEALGIEISIPNSMPDIELNLDNEEEVVALTRRLTDREKLVFYEYFINRRILREIAVDIGVTESRVCQIKAAIEVKLADQLLV